jgi:hypothetical protein
VTAAGDRALVFIVCIFLSVFAADEPNACRKEFASKVFGAMTRDTSRCGLVL